MIGRTALQIQYDVVFALFLQDMRNRFSHFALGNLWFVAEPLVMVSLFVALFGLRGSGEFGTADPPVFVAVGIVPFVILFQMLIRGLVSAPAFGRRYLLFRQVQLMDIVFVKALTQVFLVTIIMIVMMVIFIWIGLAPLPNRPLEAVLLLFSFWFFAIGFGLVLMHLASLAPEVGAIVSFMIFPLKILSAVFYPIAIVEEPYRSWLAYNPIVHYMELLREYWFFGFQSPVADLFYALYWTVGILGFGLVMFRQHVRASLGG